ncbi:MAG: hypothetical protein ACFCU8_16720 [Thermosynechococcaceae cyanobacterium]
MTSSLQTAKERLHRCVSEELTIASAIIAVARKFIDRRRAVFHTGQLYRGGVQTQATTS